MSRDFLYRHPMALTGLIINGSEIMNFGFFSLVFKNMAKTTLNLFQ